MGSSFPKSWNPSFGTPFPICAVFMLAGGPTLSTRSSTMIARQECPEPPGTVILPFLLRWENDMKVTFLEAKLARYIKRLVNNLDFVLSNPIGNRSLNPHKNVYKTLVKFAQLNKLTWTLTQLCHPCPCSLLVLTAPCNVKVGNLSHCNVSPYLFSYASLHVVVCTNTQS